MKTTNCYEAELRDDCLVEHGGRSLRGGRAGIARLHGARRDAAGGHQKRRGRHQVLDQDRERRRLGNSRAARATGVCLIFNRTITLKDAWAKAAQK